MFGEDLSRAMGDLSDGMVTEAMHAYNRKRRKQKLWLRVAMSAAALALVVGLLFVSGGDGVVSTSGLKVYALDAETHEAGENAKEELKKHETIIHASSFNPMLSLTGWEGIILSFEIEDPEIDLETVTITATATRSEVFHRKYNPDDFVDDYTLPTTCVFSNGEVIRWTAYHTFAAWIKQSELSMAEFVEQLGGMYLDVVIRSGEHIIGYAVLEMWGWEQGAGFSGKLLESEYFPMADGAYQQITQEQVDGYIAAAKEK